MENHGKYEDRLKEVEAPRQPLIYLFLFYASRLDPEDMEVTEGTEVTLSCSSTDGRRAAGRHLRLFGGPKVTGCLVPLRQTALLTTFLETLFFWSPLVPLLSLAILSATLANHFVFDVAVWNFHVQVPSDAMNRGAFLSRRASTSNVGGLKDSTWTVAWTVAWTHETIRVESRKQRMVTADCIPLIFC